MAITPMTDDLNIIAGLDDEPNDVTGLTAAQLKAKYDAAGNTIKDYLNNTMAPAIEADIDAAVSAAEIGKGNVPIGGAAGQVITKNSDADYDFGWGAPGTSAATPNTLMKRDANGRVQVADPSANGDITNKNYVDSVLSESSAKSLLRDLNIMLNLSLGTPNFDAWTDFLVDSSRINTSLSSNYALSDGKIAVTRTTIIQTYSSNNWDMGQPGNTTVVGQTFTPTISGVISGILINMLAYNSPADMAQVRVYASDKTTLLGTSNPTQITASQQWWSFSFTTPINVVAGTTYYFGVSRTGNADANNYYRIAYYGVNDLYAGGSAFYYNSAWYPLAYDLMFTVYVIGSGTIVWNAVTSTTTLSKIVVCPDQALNSGTITFYVSPDGTNWTQITSINAAQAVSLSGKSLYLKAVLTSTAELKGVAWGGY